MRLILSVFLLSCLLTVSACSTLKMPFNKKEEPAKQVTQEKVSAAPEKVVTVAPVTLETIHVVESTETLEKIARLPQVYGDGRLWPVLFEANRKELYHPAKIYPGQKLAIPRDQAEILKLRKQAVTNKVYEMVGQTPPKIIKILEQTKQVKEIQSLQQAAAAGARIEMAPTAPFKASVIRSSWTGEEKTSN